MKPEALGVESHSPPETRLAHRLRQMPRTGPGQHSTKLKRSVYSGSIAALLREAIIEGDLPAGTPLVEARLAEQLSVSRGPVRSALNVLAGEGLVKTMPNGRSAVAGFDERDVHDLLNVRHELEARAIHWGVERRREVRPIEAAFAAIEAEGASTLRLVDLDVNFHLALVEFSGSRFLVQAWLAIAPVVHTLITVGNRRLAAHDPESHFTRIVASHRPLVEALAAYDAEGATAMLAEQFNLTESMFATREDNEGATT